MQKTEASARLFKKPAKRAVSCHTNAGFRHYDHKCMILPRELLEQVAALHADAFCWAVTCCAGNGEAGADALQEAYIKIATGRAMFAGRSSLKTWWLAVVRLTAFEQRRGEQRWQRMAQDFRDWLASLGSGTPASTQIHPAKAPDPDQLAAALAQLPARQAEVLHLVFQQDLSLTEASAVMGVSVGSARQHYERAKKRLRQLLASNLPTSVCDHAS
jgi:RNA polymerase sigma factor (sigma-70 family)